MNMKKRTKWKAFLCMMLVAIMIFPTAVYAEESQEANTATKTLKVNISETDWQNVKVHYWGGTSESKWPGAEMTAVDGETGVYTYAVPADSTGVIFNSDASGTMKQTVNITDIRDDVVYYVQPTEGKAVVVMKDQDGNVVEPVAPKVDTMKVRFDNSKTNWGSVSIHYWGSGVTGTEWPGAAMALVEGSNNVYEVDVPVGITGIVFTNPSDPDHMKSSDVTDIPTREEWEADNSISAEYVSVGYEYEKYVVLRKDANGNTYNPPEPPETQDKIAKQVNTHIGSDYSYVNLSFTTVGKTEGKVTLTDAAGEVREYTGEGVYSPSAEKYKYTVVLDGLKPDTAYTYTIGEGDYAVTGTFRSIPAPGGNETLKFAYLVDTQVGTPTDAEAANATLNFVNQYKDLGFVYIGGDITDNSDSKVQWETLFESANGQYPTGGKECLSNNLLAVVQGNHDKNNKGTSLSGYITAPDDGGNLVYSFDYGNVKFIALNLETANGDDAERDSQRRYLEKEVKEAKEAGQWTIVGFHKSIYTGASHIIDGDIVAARKFWSPILAELDVDVVLQAHDHVFARGFINGDGTRGDVEADAAGAYISQDNTPLYYVGGHAGGLKWYAAKEYTVGEGDPLLENYEFLDVNSATCENPTSESHESMYTIFEVSNGELKTTTYAFKYDQTTHAVTKEPYVYDSLVLKREVAGESQQPSTPQQPTTPQQTYKVVAGADGTYEAGNGGSYTLRVDGELEKFVDVYVDGVKVPTDMYTVQSGSTIITFKAEFMESLSAGTHTIQVNYTDGSVSTTLKVNKAETNNNQQTNNTAGSKASPKTGDNTAAGPYVMMLLAAGLVTAQVVVERKKKAVRR